MKLAAKMLYCLNFVPKIVQQKSWGVLDGLGWWMGELPFFVKGASNVKCKLNKTLSFAMMQFHESI